MKRRIPVVGPANYITVLKMGHPFSPWLNWLEYVTRRRKDKGHPEGWDLHGEKGDGSDKDFNQTAGKGSKDVDAGGIIEAAKVSSASRPDDPLEWYSWYIEFVNKSTEHIPPADFDRFKNKHDPESKSERKPQKTKSIKYGNPDADGNQSWYRRDGATGNDSFYQMPSDQPPSDSGGSFQPRNQ